MPASVTIRSTPRLSIVGDIKPARQGNNSIRISDKTRDLALYCSHMDLYRLFSLSEIYTETKQEDIFVKFFIHFTHQECLLSGMLPINPGSATAVHKLLYY